jgi:hypothetical protein
LQGSLSVTLVAILSNILDRSSPLIKCRHPPLS